MKELYKTIKEEVIAKLERGYRDYIESSLSIFPASADKMLDMLKPYLTIAYKSTVDSEGDQSVLANILLRKKLIDLIKSDPSYEDYSYQKLITLCALNQYEDPTNELIDKGIENGCWRTVDYINNNLSDLHFPLWSQFPYKELLDKIESDFISDLNDTLTLFVDDEMDLSKLIDRSHNDYLKYINKFKESKLEDIVDASKYITFFGIVDKYFSERYSKSGDTFGLYMMRFEDPISLLLNVFFQVNSNGWEDITSYMDDDGIELLIRGLCDRFELDQEFEDTSFIHPFKEILHEAFPECFKEKVTEEDNAD